MVDQSGGRCRPRCRWSGSIRSPTPMRSAAPARSRCAGRRRLPLHRYAQRPHHRPAALHRSHRLQAPTVTSPFRYGPAITRCISAAASNTTRCRSRCMSRGQRGCGQRPHHPRRRYHRLDVDGRARPQRRLDRLPYGVRESGDLGGGRGEIAISTDHNFISDWRPAVNAYGIRPWMTSCVGIEFKPL